MGEGSRQTGESSHDDGEVGASHTENENTQKVEKVGRVEEEEGGKESS